MTDFKKSQKAHMKLMLKNARSPNKYKRKLSDYHSLIYSEQLEKKRVLTKREKKSIFNLIKVIGN